MRRFWRVTKDVWWGMLVGGGVVASGDADTPWPISAIVYLGWFALAAVVFYYWVADKGKGDR